MTLASPDTVLLEHRSGAIATLTLNRAHARNSLSVDLMTTLNGALERLGQDASVKVIVLAAAGPVFCSGHDLKEMQHHRADADAGKAFYHHVFTLCGAMMQTISAIPKPVIAQVQGMATAAGCQLVAACDLAVAAHDARFATPGVNIGLFCSTPMVALTRNVARKPAMEMLLLGDPIDAETAKTLGLVNRVVASDVIVPETLALAEQIAQKPSHVVAIGKEAFHAQADMSVPEAYAYTADVMVRNMLDLDAQEGIGAFLDKREPEWR